MGVLENPSRGSSLGVPGSSGTPCRQSRGIDPPLAQTHIHRVGDAIQPSHPLSSSSPPATNPSQLASRVAQGVSGPSSSCVWNPRVFADDARGCQCSFLLSGSVSPSHPESGMPHGSGSPGESQLKSPTQPCTAQSQQPQFPGQGRRAWLICLLFFGPDTVSIK